MGCLRGRPTSHLPLLAGRSLLCARRPTLWSSRGPQGRVLSIPVGLRPLSTCGYPLFDASIVSVQEACEQVRLIRVRVGSKVVDATLDVPAASASHPGVDAEGITFEAGQWVDFHVPGINQIGGYTIVSGIALPTDLASRQFCPTSPLEFDLAVKKSKHPPAAWVHSERCRPGSCVQVRVGGSFTLKTVLKNGHRARGASCNHLVFLAGGVGINPLYAMMLQLAAWSTLDEEDVPLTTLVYSAKTGQDRLFMGRLETLVQFPPLQGRLRLVLMRTGRGPQEEASQERGDDTEAEALIKAAWGGSCCGDATALLRAGEELRVQGRAWVQRISIGEGRISQRHLQHILGIRPAVGCREGLADAEKGVEVAICGPPAFTDSMEALLKAEGIGLTGEQIHTERWW